MDILNPFWNHLSLLAPFPEFRSCWTQVKDFQDPGKVRGACIMLLQVLELGVFKTMVCRNPLVCHKTFIKMAIWVVYPISRHTQLACQSHLEWMVSGYIALMAMFFPKVPPRPPHRHPHQSPHPRQLCGVGAWHEMPVTSQKPCHCVTLVQAACRRQWGEAEKFCLLFFC